LKKPSKKGAPPKGRQIVKKPALLPTKKSIWTSGPVVVRIHVVGDVVYLPPTKPGGPACIRFYRSAKGIPPFQINVNGRPDEIELIKPGMRIGGHLRVMQERSAQGAISHYCVLDYDPTVAPTHKLKVFSLASHLKPDAKPLYQLLLGEGVLAVLKMEKPPLK